MVLFGIEFVVLTLVAHVTQVIALEIFPVWRELRGLSDFQNFFSDILQCLLVFSRIKSLFDYDGHSETVEPQL